MPTVTVELPSLLVGVVGAGRTTSVEAASVRAALEALIDRHPAIGIHLFDETGDLREHVLCLHNQANTRWSGTLDAPVAEGDVITILQAVSGGERGPGAPAWREVSARVVLGTGWDLSPFPPPRA